jgi:hypothetical protein
MKYECRPHLIRFPANGEGLWAEIWLLISVKAALPNGDKTPCFDRNRALIKPAGRVDYDRIIPCGDPANMVAIPESGDQFTV